MDLTSLRVDSDSVGRHSTVVEVRGRDSSTAGRYCHRVVEHGVEDSSTAGRYSHTDAELRGEDSSTAGTYAQPSHIENYAVYHLPAVPSDTHMTDHRSLYPWDSYEFVNIHVHAYFHCL